MENRGILATLFSTVLAGGAAAVIGATALPTGSPYFDMLIIVGCAAMAVGFFGLLWMLFSPAGKPPEHRSITAKASDEAIIELEDFVSSADTLADATGRGRISAKGGSHTPASGVTRRSTGKASSKPDDH